MGCCSSVDDFHLQSHMTVIDNPCSYKGYTTHRFTEAEFTKDSSFMQNNNYSGNEWTLQIFSKKFDMDDKKNHWESRYRWSNSKIYYVQTMKKKYDETPAENIHIHCHDKEPTTKPILINLNDQVGFLMPIHDPERIRQEFRKSHKDSW